MAGDLLRLVSPAVRRRSCSRGDAIFVGFPSVLYWLDMASFRMTIPSNSIRRVFAAYLLHCKGKVSLSEYIGGSCHPAAVVPVLRRRKANIPQSKDTKRSWKSPGPSPAVFPARLERYFFSTAWNGILGATLCDR